MSVKKIFALILVAILVFSIPAFAAYGAVTDGKSATVELSTPSGPIRGTQSDGISMYKGIPYAAPPVGELRFAPTQPVKPWTETLDCTKFGPTAVQPNRSAGLPMSEDCLTLNVWTPAKGGEKLPVYVFIHGGAFIMGSGAEPLYDGTNFAKDSIVAITINYRLGGLGYYASQETFNKYGTTGNWAILDQIQALKWIQENVAAFGGDPNRVTVGGESAGSYSVSALLLSPLAKGLFQNAIMESGSILEVAGGSHYAKGNLARSIAIGNELGLLFSEKDDAARLSKMRTASASFFSQVTNAAMDFSKFASFGMLNCYDGKVLPTDPVAALENGNFNKVNLLLGYNADEGSVFVPEGVTKAQYEMMAIRAFGYDKAKEYLTRYPADDANTPTQRARQMVMDVMFSTGMKETADSYAAYGQNVYFYRLDFASIDTAAAGLGARHGSELAYVFGNLAIPGRMDMSKDRNVIQMSAEMHKRWVNFIKTGDPNKGKATPSGVVWPKFSKENAQIIRFNNKTTVGTMPDKAHREYMQNLMFGETRYYK